jgi:hypothetical protein
MTISLEDVSKVFKASQNHLILDALKNNATVFRRVFDLCVSANIIPFGMTAMNRKSILNAISSCYGFADFQEVEQASIWELERFKTPIKNQVFDFDWMKAIKNANYYCSPQQIEAACEISNKILGYILSKGLDNPEFGTLLKFKILKSGDRSVYIQNRSYGKLLFNSDNLFWEMIMVNVIQHVHNCDSFNKEDFSITLKYQDIVDCNTSAEEVSSALKLCPKKLIGGKILLNQGSNGITFIFSKKLLSRVQYKSEKISFLEMLGLNSNNPFHNQPI